MKDRIGNYLLDISKLIFAGMVLGVILDIGGVSKTAVLITGVWTTIVFALIGFALTKK